MVTNYFNKSDVVQSSCNTIIESVRTSFLNYSIQETPYSIFLTIRKSLNNATHYSQSPAAVKAEVAQQTKPSTTAAAFEKLQEELDEVVNQNEGYINEIGEKDQ